MSKFRQDIYEGSRRWREITRDSETPEATPEEPARADRPAELGRIFASIQSGALRKMTLISLRQIKGPRHVLPLDGNLEPQARPVEDPSIGRRYP